MVGRIAVAVGASTIALLAAAGCSSASDHGAPSGWLTGELRLTGGPVPSVDTEVSGTVYAYRSPTLTGSPVAQATAKANGGFRLKVAAGTYYLAATSPSYNIDPPPPVPPCHGTEPAVVTVGHTTQVDVICAAK